MGWGSAQMDKPKGKELHIFQKQKPCKVLQDIDFTKSFAAHPPVWKAFQNVTFKT